MEKMKAKLAALVRGEKLTGGAITALFIGVIIAVNAVVYALTVGFGLYLYSPDETDTAISGATDSLFEKYEGEHVTIMFCRAESEFDPSAATNDEVTVFHDTAKQFAERYPDLIDLEYVNILTKRNSKGELVDLSLYQDTDETSGTTYPIFDTSVIFLSEDQHRTLYDVASSVFYHNSSSSSESYQSYNGEEVIASMVSWVLADEHKTAYFTTYHGETSEVYFANMLTCSGYSIGTVDLTKNEVPEDADLVVISNPHKDFEQSVEGSHVRAEIDRLRTYVEEGGSLYVALDPYVEKLNVLESFLAEYGISFSEEVRDGKTLRNIVKDSNNAVTTDNFTLIADFADNEYGNALSESVENYNDGSVIIRECAALNLSKDAKPVFVTSSSSSTYAGGEQTDKSGNYCVGAIASTKSDDGAAGSIFVVPSVYLTANDALTASGYANRDFIYAMMEHLFGAESVPYGCTPIYMDSGRLENLTMGTARLYTALLLSIPVLIAVCGVIVVLKRKNR